MITAGIITDTSINTSAGILITKLEKTVNANFSVFLSNSSGGN